MEEEEGEEGDKGKKREAREGKGLRGRKGGLTMPELAWLWEKMEEKRQGRGPARVRRRDTPDVTSRKGRQLAAGVEK